MESLVSKIKQAFMSSPASCSCSLVSTSAYDTAWVAMVPHSDHPGRPMFPRCLHWVLRSQRRPGGFWGHTDHRGLPTLDCLTATLACMVALHTWGAGEPHCIEEGLEFLRFHTGEILATHYSDNGGGIPRWFTIVFPGMLERAQHLGLDVLQGDFFNVVEGVFEQRRRVLDDPAGRDGVNRYYYPLESYLEVLPADYAGVDCADIVASHLDNDGSLFRSPSATAFAFMSTGKQRCRAYLETMLAEASAVSGVSHGVGVPAVYPVDEQLHKLLMVDVLERLGIAEHFMEEIADALRYAHSHWRKRQEPRNNYHSEGRGHYIMPMQLYTDALAFRLLRMHGYRLPPGMLCWFLHDEGTKVHMEKNHGFYLSAMLNVYRATHLTFPGEQELEEAKSFSERLLQKGALLSMNLEDALVIFMDFRRQATQELEFPWLSRMEHLEHRRYIEEANSHALWVAKASFYKFAIMDNTDILRLAVENFAARQVTYRDELEEMKRWSEDLCLSTIGFGREKTAYIYFSTAVSLDLCFIAEVRKIITKCAVLVTVADDFYDMEGELEELQRLTVAVERWEGVGLSGHSKVIFDALHSLVEDLGLKFADRHGYDVVEVLRNIWVETFRSWLQEAEWSRRRHAPTVDEYIKVGMISIAIQAIILPACYLLNPRRPENTTRPHYAQITKHLMMLARLLNDLQSYEKEYLEGKLNIVMLLEEVGTMPVDIGHSVASVSRLLEERKKEFLELALVEGDVPNEWKQVHLMCLKAFQMFYNGENAFDSPTALLRSIHMAIYDPVTVESWPRNDPAEEAEKRPLMGDGTQ